ncbi:MAG: hypothetical protein LC130_09275 [Bryobacterales bacterium]|nr:hypothetical protein [Bryobacterales bacterium]
MKTPPYLEHVRSQTYFNVLMPASRPVVVTCAYTTADLSGVHGLVTVSTSHGMVLLNGATSRIHPNATDGDPIVYRDR